MKVGGHTFRDHLRVLAPLFGFIGAVWALRLVLSAAGTPPSVVRLCSVTVAVPVAVLLVVLMVHHDRFGGYANVALAALLLSCWAELLIVAALAFSVVTGIGTVYSAPEYSGGFTLLQNMIGHLTIGIGMHTLFGIGMGCLLLCLLRRIVPSRTVR